MEVKDNERCCVRVAVSDDKFHVLCSLTPGKVEQQITDLMVLEGDTIQFSTTGNSTIHLTGNFLIEDDNECHDDHEDEENLRAMLANGEYDSEMDDEEIDSDEFDSDLMMEEDDEEDDEGYESETEVARIEELSSEEEEIKVPEKKPTKAQAAKEAKALKESNQQQQKKAAEEAGKKKRVAEEMEKKEAAKPAEKKAKAEVTEVSIDSGSLVYGRCTGF